MNPIQKIAIVGMPCSGSTLFFNIVRLCFEYNNKKVSSLTSHINLPEPKDKILIYKGHRYKSKITNWADVILTSRRDVRDAVASQIKKEPKENKFLKIATDFMNFYYRWKGLSDFEFQYENYKQNPFETAKKISVFLDLPISDVDINNIIAEAENIKNNVNAPSERLPSEPFYKKTLFHKNQITSGGKIGAYKDFFSESAANQLDIHCQDWLLKNDYTI